MKRPAARPPLSHLPVQEQTVSACTSAGYTILPLTSLECGISGILPAFLAAS